MAAAMRANGEAIRVKLANLLRREIGLSLTQIGIRVNAKTFRKGVQERLLRDTDGEQPVKERPERRRGLIAEPGQIERQTERTLKVCLPAQP